MPPVDILYRTIIHFNKQTLQMRRQRTMRAPLRGEGWKETWRTSVLWRTPSGLLRSCSHPSTAPEGTPPHRTSWKWKVTLKNDHGSSPYQAAKSCSEVNWSNCCNKILNCFPPPNTTTTTHSSNLLDHAMLVEDLSGGLLQQGELSQFFC